MSFSMTRLLALLAVFFLSPATFAQGAWRGSDGQPVADEESRRSVNGFGGWLVVTPDVDWEVKWNTPHDVIPSFRTADQVRLGDGLTVLIFFANPRKANNGSLRITCDIRVIRPDGTLSVDARRAVCAKGLLQVDPATLFLADEVLNFIGELGDPLGQWTVEVTLHDDVAAITVPLRTRFTLVH